jgi:hypothetical protein
LRVLYGAEVRWRAGGAVKPALVAMSRGSRCRISDADAAVARINLVDS